MKFIRIVFFLLPSLCAVNLFGQDSLTIYFETGTTQISNNQKERLSTIQTRFDLSELDSIHFIGIADSVGELKSNFHLSEKRARNAFKYCKRILPENVPAKIIALGEKASTELKMNRRVDVVLYFKPAPAGQIEVPETIAEKQYCYTIDYKLLHKSHIRTIIKKSKVFVIIECATDDFQKNKVYYGGAVNKSGTFVAQKLKWSLRRTGKFWWSKTRYVASIPKKDFDAYKIFKIEEPPCTICSEDFQHSTQISKKDTFLQVDRFLMENLQFKTMLFNTRKVHVRVPKEYVTIEDHYYIGCNSTNMLQWDTRAGRRKKNYYYTELPIYFNYLGNITRTMDDCKLDPSPSECDKGIINCHQDCGGGGATHFILEVGSNSQQKTIVPYLGVGLFKTDNINQARLLIGTQVNLGLYGSIEFQHNFISFPFSLFKPVSSWRSGENNKPIYRFAQLYFGTELKTTIHKERENYLEQNIHIGLSAAKFNGRIPRIFIQYGLGFDYLGNISKSIYPVAQLGLWMRIAKL